MDPRPSGTEDPQYTARLLSRGGQKWKVLLDVQRPYRWNMRRLQLGRTLDVGCGLGRNLVGLGPESVGVDHNPASIATARQLGHRAYTSTEFPSTPSAAPEAFDSMLVAHVVEHMEAEQAVSLIGEYRRYIRPGGKLVVITPQEAGYRSDHTHMRFVDFAGIEELCRQVEATIDRSYSFPFPRALGRIFTYNEFVVTARFS